jgi:hypothetical protein
VTLGIGDYELGAFGSLATVSTTLRRCHDDLNPTFQCLPAEVAINYDGTVTFTSAIPGLHVVDDAGIYAGLQKVLQRALPSLEMVLTDLAFGVQDVLVAEGSEYTTMQTRKVVVRDTRVTVHASGKTLGGISVTPARNFVPPTPFDAARVHLRGRRLQVITKASQIHLKPGERYAGDSWHVEGNPNECIVATIIYYADDVNVTASSLSFCAPVRRDSFNILGLTTPRNRDASVKFISQVFGGDGMCLFVPPVAWGQVATSRGRLLVFPNTLPHKLEPFELEDPSQPGWRTVIAFFVVDPHRPVLSTARVPAQDAATQRAALERLLEGPLQRHFLVIETVCDFLVWGHGRTAALRRRHALMQDCEDKQKRQTLAGELTTVVAAI